MKLLNGVVRPGIVLEALPDGCIKASAPGLFAREELSKLPPIMPFFKEHSNSFSAPERLDEVWILNFSDNPQQLFWFRKDKVQNNSSILEAGAQNVEVLCNRETDMGWASIYFSDGTGWMIKNDDSLLQLDSKGNIIISNSLPHRTIKIDNTGIHLGNEANHPAVLGDELLEILQKIVGALELVQQSAKSTPFTTPISAALAKPVMSLKQELPSFLSDHVKLD